MLANLQRIAAMMDAESIDAAPHLVAGNLQADSPPAPPATFPVPNHLDPRTN